MEESTAYEKYDECDYVVVLNDGETFTSLRGCKVLKVPLGLDTITEEWETGMDLDTWIKEHFEEGILIDELLRKAVWAH